MFEAMPALPVLQPPAAQSATRGLVVVNCAWTTPKINAAALAVLARVASDVYHVWRRQHAGIDDPLPLLNFRFYPSTTPSILRSSELMRQRIYNVIARGLPEGFVAITLQMVLPPTEYLSSLASGTLALDAIPFGGCNTIVVSAAACCLLSSCQMSCCQTLITLLFGALPDHIRTPCMLGYQL